MTIVYVLEFRIPYMSHFKTSLGVAALTLPAAGWNFPTGASFFTNPAKKLQKRSPN
jgi:hypothetical protein